MTLDAFADVIAANGAVRAANAGATDAEKEAGLALVKISLFLLIGLFLAFICESVFPISGSSDKWKSFKFNSTAELPKQK